MTTPDTWTQGRVRVNQDGALYLYDMITEDIEQMLKLRKEGTVQERKEWNLEIAIARRVLEELERVIADRWPHLDLEQREG